MVSFGGASEEWENEANGIKDEIKEYNINEIKYENTDDKKEFCRDDAETTENGTEEAEPLHVNEDKKCDKPAGDVDDTECEPDEASSHDDARVPTIVSPNTQIDLMQPHDSRPHLNIVFIGHVDAGKSTTCGNLLYLSGQVDVRTIEKYEKEAKDKNRESWFLAFVMDINEEERQKGKTVEVGRAPFETPKRRYTILDAPGHKSFVPNMISGAAQADVAVLIVSARKGEFETGFEKGGQTREHVLLAKTLGVNQIVVAINKMDDVTCNWSQQRFLDIEKKILAFLKSAGINPATDSFTIPISGLTGGNLKENIADPKSNCYNKQAEWYGKDKPTLLDILDAMPVPERSSNKSLRIPLLEGFRDHGVMAVGKVEQGTVVTNMNCQLMPNKQKVKVVSVVIDDTDVFCAFPGENVAMRLQGVEEDEIYRGSILCGIDDPCHSAKFAIVKLAVIELLEHRPLITCGYQCVMHAHTACDDVSVEEIHETYDKAKKKKAINPQFVKGNSMVTCKLSFVNGLCLEPFDQCQQLGRFTLRDEGKTIALGKILEVHI